MKPTEVGGFWQLLEGQLAECDAEMLKFGHIRTVDRPGDFSPEVSAEPYSDPWYAAKVGWRCWLTLENLRAGRALREIDGLRIMQIGQWVMEWQWHTNFHSHILRGQATLNAAKSGAAIRKGNLEPSTLERLEKMRAFLKAHPEMGVSWAAERTHKAGCGVSAKANRALWYRHNPRQL